MCLERSDRAIVIDDFIYSPMPMFGRPGLGIRNDLNCLNEGLVD